MIKIYVDRVICHPFTGEEIHDIVEVEADVPELEKVLFDDTQSEYRKILDVKRIEGSGKSE